LRRNDAGMPEKPTLRRGAEAAVGRKRDQKDDFQHSGLFDRQAVEGGPDLGLAAYFPEDGRAGHVATAPDLANEAGGVKFLDSL